MRVRAPPARPDFFFCVFLCSFCVLCFMFGGSGYSTCHVLRVCSRCGRFWSRGDSTATWPLPGHTPRLVCAGILNGTSTCQAATEDDDDDDEFADMQDAEEALLEAAADAIVALAPSLGAPAFMDAWKVRPTQLCKLT